MDGVMAMHRILQIYPEPVVPDNYLTVEFTAYRRLPVVFGEIWIIRRD